MPRYLGRAAVLGARAHVAARRGAERAAEPEAPPAGPTAGPTAEAPGPVPAEDRHGELMELEEQLDAGVLTQAEFDAEKQEVSDQATSSCGRISGVPTLHLSQDDAADELLGRDPLALLLGMLLDQQFPMERAFAAPRLLADRLGVDTLSAAELATCDPEVLQRHFQGPPALHRYPGSMAARAQDLARLLVERYDGRAEALWSDVPDAATLLRRLGELPGFGAQKSRIFLALLGKQYGVTPPGWREAAGDYGQEGSRRSVADITGPASLAEVRATKQQLKQAAKDAKAAQQG